ncbi:MAG: DUF2948 family protein, partial [Pseudomonadota bacterium]
QDCVFPATEIAWHSSTRRLAILLNRFRWEDGTKAEQRGRPFERVQTVLQIEDVTAVRSQGFSRGARDLVVSILGLRFQPGKDGAGTLELTLAGDGIIAAEVETINLRLQDVTRPYAALSGKMPAHPDR